MYGGSFASAAFTFSRNAASTPSTSDACTTFSSAPRTSARSAVVITETDPTYPSGVLYWFSGDVDGAVTRNPSGPSTSQSRANSAAPFINGYAVVCSHALSPPNAKCSHRCRLNHSPDMGQLAHTGLPSPRSPTGLLMAQMSLLWCAHQPAQP